MRFSTLLAAGSVLSFASASIFSSSPDLDATATFPEDNPLSVVYNGKANIINVKLLNRGKSDLSIDSISGAFKEVGGKERHLANSTAAKYSLVLPAGSARTGPVDIPYRFYSELKPQDLSFVVYVDYTDTADLKGAKYRAVAYDGTVTVKEPLRSWTDLHGLLLWPVLFALLGLPFYFLYTSVLEPRFFPKTRKGKAKKSTAVVAKSPTPRPATPSDPSEWIPEHHLKTRRTVSGRNLVKIGTGGITPQGATSGDETSGNEGFSTPRRSARETKGKKKAL